MDESRWNVAAFIISATIKTRVPRLGLYNLAVAVSKPKWPFCGHYLLLQTFQACTGIEDVAVAFTHLDEVKWDLLVSMDVMDKYCNLGLHDYVLN